MERGPLLRGKYELLELAGTGGMAEVHRGRTHGAAGFRRFVAIKRILESFSHNHEFVTMFVEEARVASDLVHPNIVQIHDFDQDETGRYYLVMEWVDGLNLADWTKAYRTVGQPTPWPLVAAIGIEVLKALASAHERQSGGIVAPVVHRDVTPQNILVSATGIVKLADFGLARAMDRARITQPDILKGKVSYVAPELVEGQDATARSDLFAVGVVLYETLVGEKLFQGDTPVEILQKVRATEIPSVSARRPDAPPELHSAIHRVLSQSPEGRFPTARSMARALANILRMTPTHTGADVIGRSVVEARSALVEAEADRAAESGDVSG